MQFWIILLDYIRALVWPSVVLYVLIRYHSQISTFLQKLNKSASELSISPTGISAKFGEEIKELKQMTETISELPGDQGEVKNRLDETALNLIRQRFAFLASKFFDQPIEVREQAAEYVRQLAPLLPINEILRYAASSKPGERVAAAISLGVAMRADSKLGTDPRVSTAITSGLRDSFSRVRYRFVEAMHGLPDVLARHVEVIRSMSIEDENDVVRNEATSVLRQI